MQRRTTTPLRPVSLITLLTAGSIFLSGCSIFGGGEGRLKKQTPYPALVNALDEEYLHSPFGDVAARYPAGWLHVDISTIPLENVQEVYTDPARRRALVLAELPATAEFRRSVERDGMLALAERSFSAKTARLPGKLVLTRLAELYTVNDKLFASYQYADAGHDTLHRRENRIVLFTTGPKWYELGMVELVPPTEPSEHLLNFRLLESVIGSLEGAARVRASDSTSF